MKHGDSWRAMRARLRRRQIERAQLAIDRQVMQQPSADGFVALALVFAALVIVLVLVYWGF